MIRPFSQWMVFAAGEPAGTKPGKSASGIFQPRQLKSYQKERKNKSLTILFVRFANIGDRGNGAKKGKGAPPVNPHQPQFSQI
jgi:hypothetical protein